MNKLKLWLEQTMMISFAILVGILFEGAFYALTGDSLESFSVNWIQLFSFLLTGALCSIPTLLFLVEKDYSKKQFIVVLICHALGLYAIVCLIGFLFKWYTELSGFIMITIIFFMVYIFVWVVSMWFHKRDEKQINKALDDIRDEE